MTNDLFIFNDPYKPGIGYQEYKNLRKYRENLRSSQLEHQDYKRHIVYFGRMHLTDYSSNIEVVGPMKIGKTYYPTSLFRARNEAGGEFRLYAEIVLYNQFEMDLIERIAHRTLNDHRIEGPQGQKELFNLLNIDLDQHIDSVLSAFSKKGFFGLKVQEVLKFDNNEHSIYSISKFKTQKKSNEDCIIV